MSDKQHDFGSLVSIYARAPMSGEEMNRRYWELDMNAAKVIEKLQAEIAELKAENQRLVDGIEELYVRFYSKGDMAQSHAEFPPEKL